MLNYKPCISFFSSFPFSLSLLHSLSLLSLSSHLSLFPTLLAITAWQPHVNLSLFIINAHLLWNFRVLLFMLHTRSQNPKKLVDCIFILLFTVCTHNSHVNSCIWQVCTWKVCPLYCIVHSPYKQLTYQPSHSLPPSMGLLRHTPIMINKHNQIFNSCIKSLHTFSARPPKCQCWINFIFNLNQSIKHHWTACVQVHLILLHSRLITRFIRVLYKSHTYSIIWLVMT